MSEGEELVSEEGEGKEVQEVSEGKEARRRRRGVSSPIVKDGRYYCYRCGSELKYVLSYPDVRTYVHCPNCNARFKRSAFPEEMIMLTSDVGKEKEGKEEKGDAGVGKAPPEDIISRPKLPHEIVYEVLKRWRIRDEVISFIVDYFERTNTYNPLIIYTILQYGNPGRKLTEIEIQMILSEIENKVRDEYTKAQALRMAYPYLHTMTQPVQPPFLPPSNPYLNPLPPPPPNPYPLNPFANIFNPAPTPQQPTQQVGNPGTDADEEVKKIKKMIAKLARRFENTRNINTYKILLEQQKNLMNMLITLINKSSGGWSDDYARMIAETVGNVMGKALELAKDRYPIKELKEMIAPKLPEKRVGEEEDIYRLLAREGAELG